MNTSHAACSLDNPGDVMAALEAHYQAYHQDSAAWQALRWEVARLVGDSLVSQATIGRFLLERAENCIIPREIQLGRIASRQACATKHDDTTLRLRVAAFAAAPQDSPPETFFTNEIGAPTRSQGGVVHATVGGNTVILLPDFESKAHCSRAAADLMRIFDDQQNSKCDWILDFSSVTHLPSILLLGLLASLKADLAAQGRRLIVLWFRPPLFRPSLIARLIAPFDLELVAGYLFSRTTVLRNFKETRR